MFTEEDHTWYDYTEAARRVKRSRNTIRRWRRDGMPMSWRNGARVVRQDVLLAWWRDRMKNDPIHQQRLKKRRLQNAQEALEGQP